MTNNTAKTSFAQKNKMGPFVPPHVDLQELREVYLNRLARQAIEGRPYKPA